MPSTTVQWVFWFQWDYSECIYNLIGVDLRSSKPVPQQHLPCLVIQIRCEQQVNPIYNSA